MDSDWIKNEKDHIIIPINNNILKSNQELINKKWEDFLLYIDSSYKTILNNITSPLCGKVSIANVKQTTIKKKPKEEPENEQEKVQVKAREGEVQNEKPEQSKPVQVEVKDTNDEWISEDENENTEAGDMSARNNDEFYDALDNSKMNGTKRKLNYSARKNPPSTVKKQPKRKKISQYFTPSENGMLRSGCMSTRSKARFASTLNNTLKKADYVLKPLIEARTATKQFPSNQNSALIQPSRFSNDNKKYSTPQRTVMTRQQTNAVISSGGSTTSCGSNSSLDRYGSTKSFKTIARTKFAAESKALSQSVQKRRMEEEEKKLLKLQAAKEREDKVMQQRKQLLEKKQMEQRMKSAEKQKRIELIKEMQRKEEEEKLKREMQKREEEEARRRQLEEEKKEILKKKQEAQQKKLLENEQRKLEQEEREKQARLLKQEELKKRQDQIKEKREQEDNISALIQQHNKNASLQQKAVVNSFLKKTDSSAQIKPNQDQKIAEEVNQSKLEQIPVVAASNSTFTLQKDPDEVNSYDITQIRTSDDEDEEMMNPRKAIPSWAKGAQFMMTLKEQYNKSSKERLKESLRLFPCVPLPVELGLIFEGAKPVASKYSHRTSSAVWSSPPINRSDISLLNYSTCSNVK